MQKKAALGLALKKLSKPAGSRFLLSMDQMCPMAIECCFNAEPFPSLIRLTTHRRHWETGLNNTHRQKHQQQFRGICFRHFQRRNMTDPGNSILERNHRLLDRYRGEFIELEPKYLLQMAHLTTPATVWKYVESAVTKSKANLVMLDLEDSIPRDNQELLEQGRANVIRAFNELDWGTRLRFFRPRGIELDPGHEDIAHVVEHAGANLDGLIYPKIEHADEVRSIDETLTGLEKQLGLPQGKVRIEPLIESASAE